MLGTMAAFVFEEKFVNFANTDSMIRRILRLLAGGVLFFGLNTVIKLPFSDAFLNAETLGAHLFRVGRYAVVLFILLAIYPMVFRYTAKIGSKKK